MSKKSYPKNRINNFYKQYYKESKKRFKETNNEQEENRIDLENPEEESDHS